MIAGIIFTILAAIGILSTVWAITHDVTNRLFFVAFLISLVLGIVGPMMIAFSLGYGIHACIFAVGAGVGWFLNSLFNSF